jgi:hypothetical protein
VSSGLELGRVDGVLVEASPLLECLLGMSVVFLVVPVQHAGRVLDANAVAELLKNGRRVVQKIISVDDTDVHSSILLLAVLTCKLGTNLAARTEVVEQATLLIVSSLGRHEVVETSDCVERGDRASPVARNAVLGVTDEEGEMELVQDVGRDNGGVSRLGLCGVGIRRRVLDCTVGVCAIGSVGDISQGVAAVGADTTLDLHQ